MAQRTISARKPPALRPKCRICQQPAPYGDLHCGPGCAKLAAQLEAGLTAKLEAAGFARHAAIPNVYVKDGVGVTLEMVNHVGLAKALAQHGHAVAAHGA
jgi:hypothetical protein